jgi:NAD(P)-dependent dehydrogenase (short-subunit alcohol dehydrogenase family)
MMQTNLKAAPPVALVTGGAQRIGKAIVEDLAAHGFAVAIHCNGSHDAADRLAEELARTGATCAVVQADLTDRKALPGLIEAADAKLGAVSLLVNNASIFEDDGATDFEWGAWDRHFAIHLEAPAMLARMMAERLPHGGAGLVVNLIDQRVWRPTPKFFSYSLSKSALWTATRTLAQALAPTVRVNAIGPGPTLANERQSEADFQRQVDALLLKRGPNLTEFGRTIRWLWDARSVTGQMIALDGGQHLAWETPDVAGMAE